MKTKTINLYSFEELSESAKKAALSKLSDINVLHLDWWDSCYEDANNVGLTITSHDQYYGCKGEFSEDAIFTANAIIENHGEHCDTYIAAQNFLAVCLPEKTKWDNENPGFPFIYEDIYTDLAQVFLKDLLKCYKKQLMDEYDYLTSEKAILETIEANEYLFFEDGKLIPVSYYPQDEKVIESARPTLTQRLQTAFTWLRYAISLPKKISFKRFIATSFLWSYAIVVLVWSVYSQTVNK